MIALDKDALICDLAENYHIYDYKSLPLQKVAIFSVGLRENSRIKMKMSGREYTMDTLLEVAILDNLKWLCWSKTKDASKGRNRPKSLFNKLMHIEDQSKKIETGKFASVEDFKAFISNKRK